MIEKEFSDGDRTVRFAQTSAPGIVNSWAFGDRSDGIYGRISGGGSAMILNGVTLNTVLSTTGERAPAFALYASEAARQTRCG
jgi:hypothetical protein